MMSTRKRSKSQARAPQSPDSAFRVDRWIDRRDLIVCGLLIAVTLLVYLQVRHFDFVIVDDAVYVGDNVHVREGISVANVLWACTTFRDGNWFPLTWISLMIDGSAYGTWAGGYHLTNLALHVLNVLLVYATFSKMTREALPSAFVAALFAVHPLHVQSVAWVAERKDVLSMFFGLCSLYAYVCYAQSGRARGLACSFLFFLCSLCAKQTFVTLPFVMLLLDYWPLGRLMPGSQSSPSPRANRLGVLLLEKVPFLVLSVAFSAVAVIAQNRGDAVLSLDVIPLGTRILNALVVYRLYLQKACFPSGLVAYYPHPGSRLGIGGIALSVVVLFAITAVAVINARRRPFLLVGWLWYLGTLVPMIGLVQLSGQQMADRYTYLPLLGCYLAVAWLVASLGRRLPGRRFVLPALGATVVAVYGSFAYVQASYWRDSVSLFSHAVAAGEENPYSLTTLGWALVNEQRFEESLPMLHRAVKLSPDFAQAQFLLGCVLQKMSQFNDASEHFRAALAADDRNAAAHLNLGTILMARRDYAQARHEFNRVVELEEQNGRVQAEMAELCLRLREYDEAVAHAKRGLEIDPSQMRCRRLLVISLRDQGRLDEAIEQLRQLLAVAPDDVASQRELQRLLSRRNDKSYPAMPTPRAGSR